MSRNIKKKGKFATKVQKVTSISHRSSKESEWKTYREEDSDSVLYDTQPDEEIVPILPVLSKEDVDQPSEELSYYREPIYNLDFHSTDCFTFPDEYVLADKFYKNFAHKRSKIKVSWVSEEDVSLPTYITVYELGPHNTDSFTAEDEYVGAINYNNRLLEALKTEESIQQISSLKELEESCCNLVQFLNFSENLVMLSRESEEIGEMDINVNIVEHESQLCMKVHIESHGVLHGVVCGMKSVGYVEIPSLETIQYNHHEFLHSNGEVTHNQIELQKSEHNYDLIHIETINENTNRTTSTFSFDEMENFVTDASSILIQRIFILVSKLDVEYTFNAFNTDCKICPIVFKPLPASRQVVLGNTLNILGIKKEFYPSEDTVFIDYVYFNKTGRILSKYLLGLPIVYRMNEIIEERRVLKENIRASEKNISWENDMELWSMFQTRKSILANDYLSYVERNEELQPILVDFLQNLLIRKPDDVISYAMKYFSKFK